MWFAANLLYRSVHNGHPKDNDLWEERIVLLSAESGEEAQKQAEALGKCEEGEYRSATGEMVKWAFEAVERVYEILDDAPGHGTEVFSRFLRAREVESLLTPFKS